MRYSIVYYSQVNNTRDFRLEAEFYNSASLLNVNFSSGAEVVDFVQYGTSKELNEESNGFPTLRLNEFDSFFIKPPQKYCDKIDENTFQSLALKKGDVLICRTNGNPRLVGKSAIVPEDYEYAFASYLFRVRPKQEIISPPTLVVYLNSTFGRAEIEKHLMVSNQANFSPAKFREILIPQLSEQIQSSVDRAIWDSFSNVSKAKTIYAGAQAILLSELGLTDWQPKRQLTYVKNFSDTWQVGRIDADYFQPKYEEVAAAIKSYPGGWDTLGNLAHLKDNSFAPEGETEYKYIELANIAGNGEITDCTIEQGKDLPSRARRKVATGDVIVSSIEGSLSSIALIDAEYDQALCSTGFHVINSPAVNSETLLVLLKSMAGQLQLKQGCSGTILTAINKDAFNRILLPIVAEATQTQIQQMVAESSALRQTSKHLLDCAKRAVEIAIEQDEPTAIEWLERETAGNQNQVKPQNNGSKEV